MSTVYNSPSFSLSKSERFHKNPDKLVNLGPTNQDVSKYHKTSGKGNKQSARQTINKDSRFKSFYKEADTPGPCAYNTSDSFSMSKSSKNRWYNFALPGMLYFHSNAERKTVDLNAGTPQNGPGSYKSRSFMTKMDAQFGHSREGKEDAFVQSNDSPMYSIKLRNQVPDKTQVNENIGPGSQSVRSKMGGTSKSFGLKLDKRHGNADVPGPQNQNPVDPYSFSKNRRDAECVFGNEERKSQKVPKFQTPGPGTYENLTTVGVIPYYEAGNIKKSKN